MVKLAGNLAIDDDCPNENTTQRNISLKTFKEVTYQSVAVSTIKIQIIRFVLILERRSFDSKVVY